MSYPYTVDQLRNMGEGLWSTRWDALVYLKFVGTEPQWTWHYRALDMNADGAITVSDIWMWAKWALTLPGDYALLSVMRWMPAAAQFLEVSPVSLGGVLSSALSTIAWILLLGLIANVDAGK